MALRFPFGKPGEIKSNIAERKKGSNKYRPLGKRNCKARLIVVIAVVLVAIKASVISTY